MSEEIKMGDAFGVVCAESHSLIDPTERWKWADFRSKKSAECAAHAINNYDRLIEENKHLREFVKSLSEARVYAVDLVSNYGGENEMTCLCDSWKENAKELLSELGGE